VLGFPPRQKTEGSMERLFATHSRPERKLNTPWGLAHLRKRPKFTFPPVKGEKQKWAAEVYKDAFGRGSPFSGQGIAFDKNPKSHG